MKSTAFAILLLSVVALGLLFAQKGLSFSPLGTEASSHQIPLPTSKILIGLSPGVLGSLNGFTPTIALSPDRRYAALLDDGYGS